MQWLKKYKTPILIGLGVFFMLAILRYFNLEQHVFDLLKHNREAILHFVDQYYFLAVAGYIFIMVWVVACGIPISIPCSVVGGFLFGGFLGGIYSLIAVTIGASTAFLTVRYFIGKRVQKKYATQLQKFNDDMRRYGPSYILTLNLLPLTPFFLINILAGLTPITLFQFAWTTALGIMPANFVYTFAGRELATIDIVSDIMNPQMILILAIISGFAIGGMLLQRYRGRKKI
ncbi:MAG: VTT domain-containing protein [Candidatus Babeliales bacterium]